MEQNNKGFFSKFYDKLSEFAQKVFEFIKKGIHFIKEKLTVGYLKLFKKKTNSDIVMMKTSALFDALLKEDKYRTSLSELEELEKEDIIVVEYDQTDSSIVQAKGVKNDLVPPKFNKKFNDNDGIIVIE